MIHLRRVKKSEGTLIDFENRLQAGEEEEEKKKGVRAERETLKETSLLFICINRSRDASLWARGWIQKQNEVRGDIRFPPCSSNTAGVFGHNICCSSIKPCHEAPGHSPVAAWNPINTQENSVRMHKVATPGEYLVSGKEQHAMWGKCMHEIKDRNRPVSQWQRYDCGCLCSVMPADRDTLLSARQV